MDQLRRTSKWVRLHDWDWGHDADRRALFPSKFFYHVLRLSQIKADGITGYSGAVDYLDYDPINHEILTCWRNPGSSTEAATPPMSSAFEPGFPRWHRKYGTVTSVRCLVWLVFQDFRVMTSGAPHG